MCTLIFNAPLTAHMNIAQLYLLVLTQNCMVSSTNMFICIQMHTNSTICTHKATYVVTFWCICISTSACITHSVNVWNIRHHVHTHTWAKNYVCSVRYGNLLNILSQLNITHKTWTWQWHSLLCTSQAGDIHLTGMLSFSF